MSNCWPHPLKAPPTLTSWGWFIGNLKINEVSGVLQQRGDLLVGEGISGDTIDTQDQVSPLKGATATWGGGGGGGGGRMVPGGDTCTHVTCKVCIWHLHTNTACTYMYSSVPNIRRGSVIGALSQSSSLGLYMHININCCHSHVDAVLGP